MNLKKLTILRSSPLVLLAPNAQNWEEQTAECSGFTEAEEKQRSEAAAHAKRSDAAKKATEEVQDSRRQTEAQIAAGPDDVSLIRDADDILLKLLQGRFYPQAMMLRLTKEQYEDTQKRFTVSEAAPH
ncbi:hypothetical protein H2248_011147 [Termitomyces sp. 'cryptogamus']|nr:hypothetical protein H2248_011147 [Termitomyces sp. 'cryptogamus']